METHDHLCPEGWRDWEHEAFDCDDRPGSLMRCPAHISTNGDMVNCIGPKGQSRKFWIFLGVFSSGIALIALGIVLALVSSFVWDAWVTIGTVLVIIGGVTGGSKNRGNLEKGFSKSNFKRLRN